MEEELGLLRHALCSHEACIEQLLDSKLDEHRDWVAEELARQLTDLSKIVGRVEICGSCAAQGPEAHAADEASPLSGCNSPTLHARAARGSGAGRSSGGHLTRVMQRATWRSQDSDYWTDAENYGQTHEVLRRESRHITHGASVASLTRRNSRILKRQQQTHISACTSLKSWLLAVYTSQWSELCMGILILANSLSIGVFAEWSMQHLDEPAPLWFNIADVFFASAFSLEIVMRCLVEGKWFVNPKNIHFRWNMFDSLLVILALMEEVLRLFAVSALKMSFVRLARLLRLVRVTRLFRLLRFFKELRLMAFGILHCAKPLAWASLFLGMLSYIFVVFLLQVTAIWLDDNFSDPTQAREAANRALGGRFPTLLWGMYTLFKSVSGGLDWSDVADTLDEISPLLILAFCLYVVITLFCVCNVITSVFLEAAHTKNSDEEANVLEHIQTKQEWMQEAKAFMDELVQEEPLDLTTEYGQPAISLKSFEALVELPRTKAFFQEQGLDVYFEKPKAVFELIDLDRNGTIDLNEFIVGLHRLKGGARSLDMHLEMRQTVRKIDKLRRLSAQTHRMLQALGALSEPSRCHGEASSPIAGHTPAARSSAIVAQPTSLAPEAEFGPPVKCQAASVDRGAEPEPQARPSTSVGRSANESGGASGLGGLVTRIKL